MSTFDIVGGVAASFVDEPEVTRKRTTRPYQQCTRCGASLRRTRNKLRPCKRCGGVVINGHAPAACEHNRRSRARRVANGEA